MKKFTTLNNFLCKQACELAVNEHSKSYCCRVLFNAIDQLTPGTWYKLFNLCVGLGYPTDLFYFNKVEGARGYEDFLYCHKVILDYANKLFVKYSKRTKGGVYHE